MNKPVPLGGGETSATVTKSNTTLGGHAAET